MTDPARAALRPLTLREAAEYGLAFMNDPEGLSEVRDLWRGWVRAYLAALPDDGQRETLHVGSIPAAAKRELDALYPKVAETVALSCLGCGQATDRFVTGSLVHDDIGLCARCVDAIRLAALPDDGRGLASPRTAESPTMKCPLCGGSHLSATTHSAEELRAWEASHPIVHINDGSSEARAMAWSEGYSEGFADSRQALRAALPRAINFRFLPPRAVDDPVWAEVAAELSSAAPPPPDDERLRAAAQEIVDREPIVVDGETMDEWCLYCDASYPKPKHETWCSWALLRAALSHDPAPTSEEP